MKVVYIGAFRMPNLDAAAPRVLNNAKALRSLGCDVSFISWGGKYREKDICKDGKYRVEGFEYVISGDLTLSSSKLERIKARLQRGRKSLKLLSLMDKPDLIILYNSDYFFTKRMLKYCKKNGVKLANDINEWFSNDELYLPDILPNYLNMTYLQKKVCNKIVISSFLDSYYSTSNNILVPPLCDKSEAKWLTTINDNRILPFDGVTLIYAGTPAKKDCIHSVVNAVNTLAKEGYHIRFIVLGISREQYLTNYSHCILDTNIHENVVFLGRVSQDLIPAYYKKADFMVLLREPNRKSMAGFPTKFAESMIAGVPVITNSTSDLPQYIRSGETGFLVDGYDYSAILNLLREKVLNLSVNEIMQLKKTVLKNNQDFEWHTYINKFKSFIESLK